MKLNHHSGKNINIVRFSYWDNYEHLFQKGPNGWRLKKEVTSWLNIYTPDSRILLDCGYLNRGEPNASISFKKKEHAEEFCKKWKNK